MLIDLDLDATHAAHFVMAGRNMNANTKLRVNALLEFFQITQALQVFQALEQAFFLVARQQQDARIAAGLFQQLFTPAIAGTRRAGLAQ
jgi:hypothetical protein